MYAPSERISPNKSLVHLVYFIKARDADVGESRLVYLLAKQLEKLCHPNDLVLSPDMEFFKTRVVGTLYWFVECFVDELNDPFSRDVCHHKDSEAFFSPGLKLMIQASVLVSRFCAVQQVRGDCIRTVLAIAVYVTQKISEDVTLATDWFCSLMGKQKKEVALLEKLFCAHSNYHLWVKVDDFKVYLTLFSGAYLNE